MNSCTSLDTYHNILSELATTASDIDGVIVDAFVEEIIHAQKVFCVGAGRSGIMLSAFCMRLNHLGIDAFIAGAIPCPPVGQGDLIIASSSSGRTPTVKAILERGQEAGARIVVFTATDESASELPNNLAILVRAPSELVNTGTPLSIQPMKALFEQTVFILCEAIVCTLKERLAVSDEEMKSRHANLE